MTLEEAVGEYLRFLVIEKGRSSATVEAYTRDLQRFTQWCRERGLSLQTIGAGDLMTYVGRLREQMAASSVSRHWSAIKGFLGFCVDEGTLATNPGATVSIGRRNKTLPKPLSEHDVTALLDGIDGTDARALRDRALLELLYGTGVRVSEAISIELQHLDFDEGLIKVTGKGNKQRLVPMGTTLRAALRAYLAPGGRSELVTPAARSRLFVNLRGGPLTRGGVDLIVRQRARAVGLAASTVSAHVFRHSCATHMLEHGADIRVVQELLGHASITTTQVYTAVSVTSLRDAYDGAHPRAHA